MSTGCHLVDAHGEALGMGTENLYLDPSEGYKGIASLSTFKLYIFLYDFQYLLFYSKRV